SGGSFTVSDEGAYRVDKALFELGIPMLGICYGMQLIENEHGAKVTSHSERNYEVKELSIIGESPLVHNIENKQEVFSATGDVVEVVPKGFTDLAETTDGAIAAFANEAAKQYGIQFYREKEGTVQGMDLIKNVLFDISGCHGDWTVEGFIESELEAIREKVGDKRVLCGLSGGVDSSVVAAIIHRAIGDQLTCIFVDHGLLRKNEVSEV